MSLQKLTPAPVEALSLTSPSQTCGTVPVPQTECVAAFLDDLRAMCALIDEAGRYGATQAMGAEYRRLRSRLARGFQDVSKELPEGAMAVEGFHGCGFEMILVSYDLDALVRGSGRKAVERLSQVWRAVHAAVSGD